MASKKRKVYFSTIQAKCFMLYELQEDRTVIKSQIFDPIVTRYEKAKQNGDYSLFQKKIDDTDEVFIVSNLHYEENGSILCGSVSRGKTKIERNLRERNPETFDIKELVPDVGNVFEEYSYFAVSIPKMQMAYLGDPAVSTNIPALVLTLLRPTVNVNYELQERSLMDVDIKQRIKQLGSKVVVKGVMKGQEQHISGGLQSLGKLEKALGAKFTATVNVHASVKRILTDSDIDTITSVATQDEGFSSFTFADERDTDKEIIDVIKNQVRYSKDIELTPEEREQPTAIWSKLCASFSSR